MNSINKKVGRFIKTARLERSMTASDFGHALNISQQQVYLYEAGEYDISLNLLLLCLEVLGKDWDDFYCSVISDKYAKRY